MGDRYYITVTCPRCGQKEGDVYYAPTCGFTTYRCPCGNVVDLEEYTGITYADASNAAEIERLVKEVTGNASS